MKPKTMILMVVAVSCGLGASYMTSRLLADRQQEVEKVTILVAKKTINMGDPIKTPEDWFAEKSVPKGEEPRTAIVKMEELKGRIPIRSLRAGDFVTPEDLQDEKGGGGVAWNLPVGHVACGIRVRSEDIAGGFASLPRSRVNILWTVRRGSDKESFCKILLENVLVLAADTQTIRNETGGAMPANVVTVALKHEDSMKLELAKSTGTLALVLRKVGDAGGSENAKLNMEDIRGNTGAAAGTEEPVEASAPPPVSQPTLPPLPTPVKEPVPAVATTEKGPNHKDHIIHIIEGGEQRSVPFRLDVNTGLPITSEIRRSPVNQPTPPVQAAPKKGDEQPAGVN